MDSLGPYEKNPHIAVALSGGSDSLCLTILAKEWADKNKGKVTALIVNHGLRKTSKKECNELQKFLKKKKIDNYCFQWKDSKINKKSIQERARKFRYKIFENFCFEKNIFHLLVAHHFEDQKETLLMRLNDNSNVYGLACMSKILFKKKIRILRPLLDFKKKEIINFLDAKSIKWFEDTSNKDLKYSRNKYRSILPELEQRGLSDNKLKKILKKAKKKRKTIENLATKWLIKNIHIDDFGFAVVKLSNLKLLSENNFLVYFGRILNTISGSLYPTKSKYILNFYKQIYKKKSFNPTNLGGCHIFIVKKDVYISREIFKKDRKQNINFKFNQFNWDNRFEINCRDNINKILKKELGQTLNIEQLHINGWNKKISKNKKFKESCLLPNKIIVSLPAIKNRQNKVLSVPQLNYYSDSNSKKRFSKMNFYFKPNIALSNN